MKTKVFGFTFLIVVIIAVFKLVTYDEEKLILEKADTFVNENKLVLDTIKELTKTFELGDSSFFKKRRIGDIELSISQLEKYYIQSRNSLTNDMQTIFNINVKTLKELKAICKKYKFNDIYLSRNRIKIEFRIIPTRLSELYFSHDKSYQKELIPYHQFLDYNRDSNVDYKIGFTDNWYMQIQRKEQEHGIT